MTDEKPKINRRDQKKDLKNRSEALIMLDNMILDEKDKDKITKLQLIRRAVAKL